MGNWVDKDGMALDFETISRIYNEATGEERVVRKLRVAGGFIYHFTTIAKGQRTESAAFVPGEF